MLKRYSCRFDEVESVQVMSVGWRQFDVDVRIRYKLEGGCRRIFGFQRDVGARFQQRIPVDEGHTM